MKKKLKYFFSAFPSYFIPKKKGYLVFNPIRDSKNFHGNIKATLLYINKHYPETQTALIMPFEEGAEEAEKFAVNIKRNILSRLWALYRAEHILVDASVKQFAYWRVSLLQLWHGSGYKSVGLKQENMDTENRKYYRRCYRKTHFFAATSVNDQKKRNESFEIETAKVTGYPRNDFFFEENLSVEKIKKKFGLLGFDKIVTYAPTYKKSNTGVAFSEQFWEKLNVLMKQKKQVFVVKKHVKEKFLTVPANYSNIVDLSEAVADVQNLLGVTDVLISDYSSIMTDFSITERPILVYAYDLEEYVKNRSMYYDLEEIFPKPILYKEEQLLQMLTEEGWETDETYKESYKHFKQLFHHYLDGNSGKRVAETILNL